MTKKKRQIAIAGMIFLVLVAGLAVYLVGQSSDKCTTKDWKNNNCVPVGRCTPPGDPREATIDCVTKNYDHKFNTSA